MIALVLAVAVPSLAVVGVVLVDGWRAGWVVDLA